MFERIIEIIMYVVSELKINKSISNFEIDKLLSDGYTKTEISTAFSWLADRFEFAKMNDEEEREIIYPNSSKSFRIFHQAELELFTKEAVQDIFQLSAMNLLSVEQIESLIEQAALTYGLMDDSTVKRTAAYSITSSNNSLPHGYRFMLTGNETIN